MRARTPLYDAYAKIPGAKLIDFHGWDLPLSFAEGIVAEHRAVRERAGLFDVSHMGRIMISGTGAERFIDGFFSAALPPVGSSRCRYGVLCNERGGCVDDVLVYRLGSARFMLVVNASNRESVLEWLRRDRALSPSPTGTERAGPATIDIVDVTPRTAQIAVQGPRAAEIVGKFLPIGPEVVASIGYYRFLDFTDAPVRGVDIISRTGYTGEDGFELYCSADVASGLWNELLRVSDGTLTPCGLGARDSLRFEAGMPLYGHEIGADITPLEAGLSRYVDFTKVDFVGRSLLGSMARSGVPRRRIGLRMCEQSVPRSDHLVFHGGKECGVVTSGGKCHTVQCFGAMALVDSTVADADRFEIEIHGRKKEAERIELPFYRRK